MTAAPTVVFHGIYSSFYLE